MCRSYLKADKFKLEDIPLGDADGIALYHAARQISPNICYFLPRNVDQGQIFALAASSTEGHSNSVPSSKAVPVDIELQYLNNKLKTVSAYFGELCGPVESQTT